MQRCVFSVLLLVGSSLFATSPAPQDGPGLIVEQIVGDSPAVKAGLKIGDSVLTYDGKPLPSPAALQAAAENTFGKQEVALRVRRGQERVTVMSPLGKLGIQVHPEIPPAALALYEEGKASEKAKKTDELITRWTGAAKAAREAGGQAFAAWLYGRLGEIHEEQRQWKEASTAYSSGWELLKESGDAAAQSRTLSALGRCSQSLNNLADARRWFEQALQVDTAAGYEMWAAGDLNNLGLFSVSRSELQSAQEHFSRALAIRERLAPNSLDVAASLHNLGNVSSDRGDFQAARDYSGRALAIRERLVPDSLDVAASLHHLGNVARERGDLPVAQDYASRAFAIRERLAPNSISVASTLVSLGSIVRARGDLSKAQELMTRAVTIYERLAPDSLNHAITINNLASVNYDRGDLQTAQDLYTRAIAIYERRFPNSLNFATSLNGLGAIHSARGDLQNAQDAYSRALAIRERLAPNSLAVAGVLHNLGYVARDRGDLQAAQDYYARALAIRERLAPNSLIVAESLNNLGGVASARGDLDMAQDYHGRALAIHERLAPDSLRVALSLSNLGNNLRDRGELQAAQNYHNRALVIRERLAPNSLTVASSLNSLGIIFRNRGDLEAARDHHSRALAIRERLASGSPATADSLNDLGVVACLGGVLQAAQEYHSRALAIRERLDPNSLDIAESLGNLGNLALKERRYSDARSLLTRAVDIIENQRRQILSTDARAFLVAKHSEPYSGLLRASLELNDLPAAFATVERARARSLLDLLTEADIDVQQGIDPVLKQREQAAHARIAWLQRALIEAHSQSSPDTTKIARLEEQLKQIEREREQLKIEIRQKHPHYAELQYPTPLGLKAIQDSLDPQTALLEYALGEDRSFLFVITRTDSFVAELPRAALLSERVKLLRETLITRPQRRAVSTYIEQARSLYRLLIGPAGKSLKSKQQLVIVPDGILHYLPFEVLLTSGDPSSLTAAAPGRWPYLVRDYGLSYVPSATVLASLQHARQARPARQKVLLAYADPAYGITEPSEAKAVQAAVRSAFGEATPWRLERLPHSREEANRIAALYPQEKVRVFLQDEAREENVKLEALLDQYRFVHFAAHGLLNEAKPQYSGLVLSLPARHSSIVDRQSEDGLLQVYEIFDLKLNADVVVLSACETGLGKEVKGEGLVGLTRAFLYAGTPSVVVSLWKVSDLSTSELMVSFYRHLKDGKLNKADALRQAQLKLINSGRFSHPYYWAPFILVGASN
jgi:CHAT domain-containing protein/Tfp pilus assembly protein PilF